MYIVELKIKNFRSYKEENSFTFEALDDEFKEENIITVSLNDGRTLRLLKSAAIYGANASGKSNVLWALKVLNLLVLNSRNFPVGMEIPYFPFLFSEESRNQNTEFTLDFILDGNLYQYYIAYNKQCFEEEKLICLHESGADLVFAKTNGGTNLTIGPAWPSTALDMKGVQLLPNHLLLSELAVKPQNKLQDIYRFFDMLEVEVIVDNINLKANNEQVAKEILKSNDSKLFGQLKQLLRIADLGVDDVDMIRRGDEEFKFPDYVPQDTKKQFIEDNRWEFRVMHKTQDGGKMAMPIYEESVGTQNLFSLGAKILSVLEKGSVLVYDEMHLAVHPKLFKLLVKLFHSPISNPKNAQLLFTTHDTTVVSDNMMRADQIWFTEKNETGESVLYSAQDFNEMKIVVPFEDWYRDGRFGAVPDLNDVALIFKEDGEKK